MSHTNSPESTTSSTLYSSTPASSPAPSLDEKQLLPDASRRQYDNIIFDIGDVLFTWSAETKTTISGSTLRKILRSATWFEYEKGNIGETECYDLVASEFRLESSKVAAAFQGARDSLAEDPKMIAMLHDLKASGTRLFAMSNISAPDWEVLRHKGKREDWELFEHVFTSAAARERKPNLGYFRHVLSETGIDRGLYGVVVPCSPGFWWVLPDSAESHTVRRHPFVRKCIPTFGYPSSELPEETGIDPERTAFVDDKLENVLTGRSLGFKGIVFTKFEDVERQLKVLFRDPIAAGNQWLRSNAKQMKPETNTGVVLEENFAQLLIFEATGDPSLVDYIEYPWLSNFFKSVLTTSPFPCDQDTTSIALSVAPHFTAATKQSVMDEILSYRNQDNIVTTHFDRTRPRIDPIVCINVLTFFYMNGRGEELSATLDWTVPCTITAPTPSSFSSRGSSPSPLPYGSAFGPLFASRMSNLFGSTGDALALSMRVLAAAVVVLCDVADHDRLLAMQELDGSWPMGWVYKYGAVDILIGSKGLTTALAVNALKEVDGMRLD
ncbi:HAD-like protein [Mycena sanguinolenta]|uniref:HAD-like protein n=1 Tax=Mycena sanguinolenta TaxID=230812 RepID=A0A8H7CTR8_9AGAR|nr:HAD-like protein [Mycena sanguinolenta]